MRLIDADKLMQMIPTEEYNARMAITYAPTVDAEPVRHGHWVDMGDFEQCSVCHGTQLKEIQTYYGKATWIKTPYCPNCGAKMDEGGEQ